MTARQVVHAPGWDTWTNKHGLCIKSVLVTVGTSGQRTTLVEPQPAYDCHLVKLMTVRKSDTGMKRDEVKWACSWSESFHWYVVLSPCVYPEWGVNVWASESPVWRRQAGRWWVRLRVERGGRLKARLQESQARLQPRPPQRHLCQRYTSIPLHVLSLSQVHFYQIQNDIQWPTLPTPICTCLSWYRTILCYYSACWLD